MISKSKKSAVRAWRIAPLILTLAACGYAAHGTSAQSAPQVQAQELARDAEPADALVVYAQTIPLGARQAEVQWLATDLELAKARARLAYQAVWSELAREVRAGSVDIDAIRPYEDAAVTAVNAHVDQEAATLSRLHDLLGPNERGAVAVNLRNDDTVRLTAAEVRPGGAAHLAKLTQMLDLDAGQQRTIASIIDTQPPMPEMKAEKDARMARVIDDFPTSSFDARLSLLAGRSLSQMVREKIEHKAAFVGQLVPILSADQRERLAKHIESHELAHAD